MNPAARCILLDLGKVVVDIDLGRMAARMQSLTGMTPAQLHAVFTNGGLVAEYESGKISNMEFFQEFCVRTGRQVTWEEFASAWNAIFVPGRFLSDDLLARLAKSADLWIISNTNPAHFQYFRENYDLLRHFRGCILSYEAGALKPDPAIFRAAVARTGVDPAQSIFVDDQISHVESARLLGFHVIHFTQPSDLDPLLHG